MDIHILVPSAFHEKLKCSLCKNFLSHFPISVCSNNESVCGRCTVPEGLISYQDEAFETICQFLKFPCRYRSEGCPEELAPKDVPQHEENCSYRVVPCFISKPIPFFEFGFCKWKGLKTDICEHVVNNHGDIMLESSEVALVLSLEMITPQCNIIRFSNRLFRLVFCIDENERYMWSVEMIGRYEEGFKFAIDIVDTNSGNRLLKSQDCRDLFKRKYLFKSFRQYCYFLKDQIRGFAKTETNQVTFNVHIFK